MWFGRLIDVVDVLSRVYMRVSGLIRPNRIGVTYFGKKFHCDIRDFIQRRIYFFKIYEPNLTYYMSDRISPDDVVLDVGANVGYISILASHLVGENGAVHSIEAAPATMAKLQKNIALNGLRNVHPLNFAATGSRCLVEIVEGHSRNIGSNAIRTAQVTSASAVQGRPVSEIAALYASDITFIKIDVEGSEGPVLDDILRNLASFSGLQTIVSELGPSSAGFIARFRRAGFRVYALPNNYRVGATLIRQYLERFREGNYINKTRVTDYDPFFTDYAFERDVKPRDMSPAIAAIAS